MRIPSSAAARMLKNANPTCNVTGQGAVDPGSPRQARRPTHAIAAETKPADQAMPSYVLI